MPGNRTAIGGSERIYRANGTEFCAEKCHSRVGEEDMSGNSERKRGRERYERLTGGWDDRDAIGDSMELRDIELSTAPPGISRRRMLLIVTIQVTTLRLGGRVLFVA